MDKPFSSYQVEERSYVAYIKREIHNQLARTKFTQTRAAEIDIIVSELASNLVKHAGSGELLYRIHDDPTNPMFEILSVDKGPGMQDATRMTRDGVSTTSTLGQGLGAINRLSNLAQLYSIPGWGTILYALVKHRGEAIVPKKPFDLEVRALCVSKPRETTCGDGYMVKHTENDILIFFGDGLGHGIYAKEAVDCAAGVFFETTENEPVAILREMHEKVRRTRGLVATIAIFGKKTLDWKICGIGNILTRMYSGVQYKNYMPYNGTIGLNIPTSMNPSVFPIARNQHLIMCSDGIQTRWDLSKYNAIFKYDNQILAAAIYRDFTRGNDDSSVLIAKVT
jgi:anti-sigma regulatory factor (Ser/Thr protein kinase)